MWTRLTHGRWPIYGTKAASNPNHHYFHNDQQNSVVSDDSFSCPSGGSCSLTGIVQNSSFDPWGQPRNANGTPDPSWGASAVTTRGYINQEQLTDTRLIDLNARVYDPAIGRFLSPDPIIGNLEDSQSWKAYAYSNNNPVSAEDPTWLDCDESGCSTEKITVNATPPPPLVISGVGVFTRGNVYGQAVHAYLHPDSAIARSFVLGAFSLGPARVLLQVQTQIPMMSRIHSEQPVGFRRASFRPAGWARRCGTLRNCRSAPP